ncbi:MAG TPA: hypothetical protein VKG78_00750, partial [Opitutaceae bacterium]|nr:hypothetical protein [Opitutaceae bacterium]
MFDIFPPAQAVFDEGGFADNMSAAMALGWLERQTKDGVLVALGLTKCVCGSSLWTAVDNPLSCLRGA